MIIEEAYKLFLDLGNIKINNRDVPEFTRMMFMDPKNKNVRITINYNEDGEKTKIKIKPLL